MTKKPSVKLEETEIDPHRTSWWTADYCSSWWTADSCSLASVLVASSERLSRPFCPHKRRAHGRT